MINPTGPFRLRIDMPEMDFACARILVFADSCARMHGHNFQVTVELEGRPNQDWFIVDLSEFEPILRGICDELNNYLLVPALNKNLVIEHSGNDVSIRFQDRQYVLPRNEVLLLDLPNTSVEMLAFYLAEMIHQKLIEAKQTNITEIMVKLAETPGNSGIYRKYITS